ncbi:MAG: FAD-binding protein [Clostridia bacterium]|nr:FAD-binding protein [Clostridia bacterium]
MVQYDIAIIGAGPAGATLARVLGQKCPDKKILLLDGETGGIRKVCGGLLSEDAQELLAKMNLVLPKDVLEDPQIFSVDTIDLTLGFGRSYVRHYLNMDRAAFDRWLISLIGKSVDITVGRCIKLEKTDTGHALTLKTDSGVALVNTKYLVGADGASSIVRRTFFKDKLYRYVSIQQWFRITDPKLPYYSCIFDKKTSDSCSWTITKGDYYIFGGAFPKNGCRKAFEEQKSRLEDYLGVKLGEPVRTEACLVASPRRRSDFLTGKDGVYLVGEAAGFISASSFEGISSAMLSGMLLADAIAEGASTEKVTFLYRKKVRKLISKLSLKIPKMKILTSPLLRSIILKSGITAIK